MHRARYIAVALVALLFTVAWPAAVVAQGAGEDQYEDPLSGGGGGGGGGGGASGGGGSAGGGAGGGSAGGGGAGGGTDVPTESAGAPSESAAQPQSGATPAQADSGRELPRTGFPVAMLLIAGVAMVVSGFSLRRNA